MQAADRRLPEEQREVLLMVGVAELPDEEAAAILDLPVGTVKSRLNRTRWKLAQPPKPRALRGAKANSPFGADRALNLLTKPVCPVTPIFCPTHSQGIVRNG